MTQKVEIKYRTLVGTWTDRFTGINKTSINL